MAQIITPQSQLDNDIATIRSQIESLRHRRSLLSNTLLSSRQTQRRLQRAKESSSSSSLTSKIDNALQITATQASTNLENVYRSCAAITAFRVRDPDPNAVDSGRVLGVRIDVFSSKQRGFVTPYYLLLNQPDSGSGGLKVHKHTLPPFIPLQKLVERYLPLPDTEDDLRKAPKQNLACFVRAVRREVVAFHKRIEVVEGLREGLGRRQGVGEVRSLDNTGREVEIEFLDKYVARVQVGMGGTIEKVVVRTMAKSGEASARRKAIERFILGGDGRVEGLAQRLSEAAGR